MGEPARQLTEPFTATPNRILDRLIGYRLPPTHRQVVDWIIRQTFGWHKPTVERDLCAISDALGIDKTAACRAIRALIDRNVIIQEGRRIAVNPAVETWGTPDADQEPTGADIDNSVKIEGESGDATFIAFKEKNNRPAHPVVPSHESIFQKIKAKFGGKNGAVKGILERIPEADRDRCRGLVHRYVKRMGAAYVERAVDYVLFRGPEKFSAYLACAFKEGWGEQWAKQRQEATEMDAQRIEAAKARREAMEAENKAIEADRAEYARERERVFNLPADRLAELERDFVGGLSGLRLKRYRKKGLKAVESEFVLYVEKDREKGD